MLKCGGLSALGVNEGEYLYLTQKDGLLYVCQNWNRFRNNLTLRYHLNFSLVLSLRKFLTNQVSQQTGRNFYAIAAKICNNNMR